MEQKTKGCGCQSIDKPAQSGCCSGAASEANCCPPGGSDKKPTIRINGQDIQLDGKESLCESCGDVCGEDVDCRVWIWQGREYNTPPKAMIVDAILRHVYGGQQSARPAVKEVPDNLKRFFAAKSNR